MYWTRRAASVWFTLICVAAALAAAHDGVQLGDDAAVATVNASTWRPLPLLGNGNELLFQSLDDDNLTRTITALSGSRVARYPGGTPSDYWNWQAGWVQPGWSPLPVRQATPAQWGGYVKQTGERSIFVLNTLTSNITYQMAALHAHADAGTPPTNVECSNECYDSTRPDVVARWPNGTAYAADMAPWIDSVHAAYPDAKVALVACAVHAAKTGPRESAWNAQVLQNPASSKADAASIHIYQDPTEGAPGSSAQQLLSNAFTQYYANADYAEATIPARFRLWITEWGIYGDNPIHRTWLQGLYKGLLTLLLPRMQRLDVIASYCAVCGDPAMPALTTPNDLDPPPSSRQNSWALTPQGEALAIIMRAANGDTAGKVRSSSVAQLAFSPNPVLDKSSPQSRQLVGWALSSSADTNCNTAVVANLGPQDASVDVSALGGTSYAVTFPKTLADATRQNITVPELGHASGRVPASGVVVLPMLSLATVESAACRR